jgi:aldehyde dehydrogenase (NAD+)
MSAETDNIFIGGKWVAPSTDRRITMISPSTEEYLGSVAEAMNEDVDRAVAAARDAFDNGEWPHLSPEVRADYLDRLHDTVEKNRLAMEQAFTREIGGPAAVSASFMENALEALSNSASVARNFAFEEERVTDAGNKILVLREPIGVVGSIISWNGPVTNVCLKVGPALAAGCTVVVKAAPEGPGSLTLLANAIEEVGFPDGVISILVGDREAGEHLVTHPGVDKIAFTGSTAAGKRIMSLCGELVRPVTLELGGKSAAIIADDIDFADVLPTLIPAGLGHSGQVCCAITRILVHRDRQQELLDGITAMLETWKVGDSSDPDTVLGPLVAERQRDRVESYIKIGIDEGATLVTGGSRPKDLEHGWFVEPTIFADVKSEMRISQEEIFGPVLAVLPFDNLDEAIAIANDSPYGLSGVVYANDTALAQRVARKIRTGQISINDFNICLTQPFGGYKNSGIGREGGPEGLGEYLETKVLQGV